MPTARSKNKRGAQAPLLPKRIARDETAEFRQTDINKLLYALGYITTLDASQCWRNATHIQRLIDAGIMQRTSRGRYRVIKLI